MSAPENHFIHLPNPGKTMVQVQLTCEAKFVELSPLLEPLGLDIAPYGICWDLC